MFFALTPMNFGFLVTYTFITLLVMLVSDSFFLVWVLMELQMILFIVLSMPSFRSSHSSLMFFFLIQSVASLMILAGCLSGMSLLLAVSFLMKLGGFPFYGWYYCSLSGFSDFPMLMSITTQKLPSLILLVSLISSINYYSIIFLILFLFIGPLHMLSLNFNLASLLVWSSSMGNVWFFSMCSFSSEMLVLYWLVYSMLVFSCILSKTNPNVLYYLMFTIAGFPPFPMFFLKLMILYMIMLSMVWFSSFIALLLVTSSVLVSYFYMNWASSNMISNFSKLWGVLSLVFPQVWIIHTFNTSFPLSDIFMKSSSFHHLLPPNLYNDFFHIFWWMFLHTTQSRYNQNYGHILDLSYTL